MTYRGHEQCRNDKSPSTPDRVLRGFFASHTVIDRDSPRSRSGRSSRASPGTEPIAQADELLQPRRTHQARGLSRLRFGMNWMEPLPDCRSMETQWPQDPAPAAKTQQLGGDSLLPQHPLMTRLATRSAQTCSDSECFFLF